MIDSHVHFWNFDPLKDGWISEDMEVLQRNYLPEDVERICGKNGITGVIAVQAAQSDAETDFLCSLAANHSIIKGVVGWTDFKSKQLPEKLEEYARQPVIKGFRHILQAEEDGYMMQSDFIHGVRTLKSFNLTYDILVSYKQLPEVIHFLEKLPDQKLIIDHCAKPPIADGKIKGWEENIRAVSKHPYLFCKVSGLVTEAPWHKWEKEDLYPYLDVVFDCFGTDRVVFGSDWPVIYTSAFYGKWIKVMQEYMQQFSKAEQDTFFTENAKAFYGLAE